MLTVLQTLRRIFKNVEDPRPLSLVSKKKKKKKKRKNETRRMMSNETHGNVTATRDEWWSV